MTDRRHLWLLATLLLVGACSSDTAATADIEPRDTSDRDAYRETADVRTDEDTTEDSARADTTAVPQRYVALRLEPSVLELETTLGEPVLGRIAALASTLDGEEIDLTGEVVWTSDSAERAWVDRSGTVTASGSLSGHVVVRASTEDLEAVAEVVVRVSQTVVDPDVSPDEVAVFESGVRPETPVGARWLYPEDGTMYPIGLGSPELQWSHDSDEVFHLLVEVDDHARLDLFTRTRALAFDSIQWGLIASDFGTPIMMTVESTAGAGDAMNRSGTRRLYTADAQLEGAVYYWQIATGDIMRIPYDAPTAVPVFSDNAESGSCRGCHAITRDGGRIGFMYNGGDNPRAGLAWANSPEPPIVANGSEFRWDSLAFEPAGLRAAAAYSGSMWLADTTPGLAGGIANLGPIPGVNAEGRAATHPAWSPDGTQLAWISRDPAGVDWSFTSGDLWVSPWNAETGVFGTPSLLVARGAGNQDTVSYPTWSPDGRWIAYSRGPDNRGEPPANLFIADPLAGDSTRLTRGAPDGLDVLPAFSPFREGGYYWLLFYSRRPYGAVTTNKQLWVMAIDERHVVGTDPSYPAFWLPGQDPSQVNITGYWARSGCSNEGRDCKTTDDCCVGLQCIDDEGLGTGVCRQVDCVLPGRACGEDDTCCPGYECATSLIGSTVCIEVFR